MPRRAYAQQPPSPYYQPYGQPQQQPYPQPQQPYQQPYPQQPSAQGTYPQQQPYGPQPVYGAQTMGQPAPNAGYDDDSGRTLEFFYARAGASGAMVASEALSKGKVRFPDATGFGGALDIGVGLRLLVLTIGPRARAMLLSNGTYLQLGGEAAFRIPMGRLDPFVGIEGGYTTAKKGDVSVNGGDLGIMGGLDYYVTPTISVGGHASASLLFLSSTGFGAVLGAHVALHL